MLLAVDDPQLTASQSDLFAPDLLAPPGEWFVEFPDWFGEIETGKVWVDSQGRVAGRTYRSGACLLDGNADECWTPPPSPTGYEAFHQGAQPTRTGAVVPVGVIGGKADHAPLHLSFDQAARYYQNTGAQLMTGRAFDAPEGGYFLGAILPHLTVADVAMIRRSGLSCDWRWRKRDNAGRPLNAYDNLGPWLVTRPGLPLDRADAQRPFRAVRAASVGGSPPAVVLEPAGPAWGPFIPVVAAVTFDRRRDTGAVLPVVASVGLRSEPEEET